MDLIILKVLPGLLTLGLMGSSDPMANLQSLENNNIDTSFAENIQEDEQDNNRLNIVIYTSYQCGKCSDYSEALKPLREREDLKIQYYHYPFTNRNGALASVCAEKQGKFYEMHDLIFANQDNLTSEKMEEHAQLIGLDMDSFNICYQSEETNEVINKEKSEGQAKGVNATPTTFIKNEKIIGAIPIENLEKIIRSYQD